MRSKYRYVLALIALLFAALACDVPDSWVDVLRRLPTLTPTPTLAPLVLFVATTGNDSNDCLSAAHACLTVSAALGKATPGSTINIGRGTFNWYGPLLPAHDVLLQGAGVAMTTLTSDSGDVIQLVHPAHVTIRGMTIAGAGGTMDGNGVEVRSGAVLSMRNCRIHNKKWGVHLFLGATASLESCTLENNQYGFENGGNLSIVSSTVRTNLQALDNYGSAQASGTSFDGNGDTSGPAGTSAVAVTIERGGSLTMTGGSVSNNLGLGIVVNTGTATLSGIAVSGNAAGGIWQMTGTTSIDTALVQNNHSYGIEIGGRSGVDPGMLTISRTAITGNQFAGLRIDNGEIHIQNTTISSNTGSATGGGGIWGYGGNLFLLDSTVAYNTGNGLDLGVSEPTSGSVTIQRSVVALNSAQECQIDLRVTLSTGGSPYVCSESWRPATLKLRPLAADAGTFVHPIDATSPLVDAAGAAGSGCPGADQRGFMRPVGHGCDVGAYEYGAAAAAGVIAPSGVLPTGTPRLPATPTSGMTLTPSPTAGPAATATEALIPTVTFVQNGNCRKGPGLAYNIVTSFATGAQAPAVGRNDQNSWIYLSIPKTTAFCWVGVPSVTVDVPVEVLPVVPTPPLPEAPGKFNDKAACVLKMKGLTVQLSWADVANASGYHLYRNGTLLASLNANVSSYLDKTAPLGHDLLYELEAFNADGSSARVQTTVSACK